MRHDPNYAYDSDGEVQYPITHHPGQLVVDRSQRPDYWAGWDESARRGKRAARGVVDVSYRAGALHLTHRTSH